MLENHSKQQANPSATSQSRDHQAGPLIENRAANPTGENGLPGREQRVPSLSASSMRSFLPLAPLEVCFDSALLVIAVPRATASSDQRRRSCCERLGR